MCPKLEYLERFAARDLPAPDHDAVEQHLAACESCRRALREIQANLAVAARLGAVKADAPAPDGAAEPTLAPPAIAWPERLTSIGP
jgi:hypothetical protein